MKSHAWRPVWVTIAAAILFLFARSVMVPADHGINERGFMYGFYRKSNEAEWKDFVVKYQTKEYCQECHEDHYDMNMASKHKVIECENCHGAALEHPEDPEMLEIDRSKELCIRCHFQLPYPTSQRADIAGIDPAEHNPDETCSECHDPHEPDL